MMIEYTLPSPPNYKSRKQFREVPDALYGIIKHRPRAEENFPQMKDFPDTQPLQDVPKGEGKGDKIPVFKPVWNFLSMINDEPEFGYTKSIGRTWINIPYEEGEVPRAEKIGIGGNFLRIIGESKAHWRIEAFPHKPFPDLDPEEYNWFQTPWLVWKVVCIDADGKLTNPTVAKRGGHVYIPYLHTKGELWIPKNRVELFPAPPRGVSYVLRGASVFAWEDGELHPLMISQGRKRDFHSDWFQLEEFGVLAQ